MKENRFIVTFDVCVLPRRRFTDRLNN